MFQRPGKPPDSRCAAAMSVDLAMPIPGSSSNPVNLLGTGEPGFCRSSKHYT
ncbi:hypothetical protein MPS_2356 [Mycobacterium pseudoshottsii JCM 15466]|nr:hypothetical protein MMMB2_0053 [Mycobacterium marinum MB2]MBC9865396.1 hypothetical protein [Mycobacterium pseudoshottsii]GAQ34940.1 hypothetical protein MPS_2356 [Mycobacterium pseudoshottsii JCM 15466]